MKRSRKLKLDKRMLEVLRSNLSIVADTLEKYPLATGYLQIQNGGFYVSWNEGQFHISFTTTQDKP